MLTSAATPDRFSSRNCVDGDGSRVVPKRERLHTHERGGHLADLPIYGYTNARQNAMRDEATVDAGNERLRRRCPAP